MNKWNNSNHSLEKQTNNKIDPFLKKKEEKETIKKTLKPQKTSKLNKLN